MEKAGPETKAAQLFQQGQYTEALQLYTTCIKAIPNFSRQDIKVNLLLNRSACYLKLKQFDKVVDDCSTILSIDGNSGKALGRKIKALSILGKFAEAQTLARHWISRDPENEQARKELKRIEVIINTLKDQEGEEDGLYEPGSPKTCQKILSDAVESSAHSSILASSLHAATFSSVAAAACCSASTTPSSTSSVSPVHSIKHNKPPPSAVHNIINGTTYSSVNNTIPGTATVGVHSNIVEPPAPSLYIKTLKSHDIGAEGLSSSHTTNASELKTSAPSLSSNKNFSGEGDTNHVRKQALSSSNSTGKDEKSHDCVMCNECFNTLDQLTSHTKTKHWQVTTNMTCKEEEGGEWKYRPPPRGLTSQEYSMCLHLQRDGSCRFGENCSQAHKEDELDEWKKRFEVRRREAQKGREQGADYCDSLLQKWLAADNKQTVMTDGMEGVNIHVNTDMSVHMSNKKCSNVWMFTVTSRVCMKRAVLLDDAHRKHFCISSITVGPKKAQKSQKLEDNSQDWINPVFQPGRTANEKVYRMKILFLTDIYGTFRQSVVFDFGTTPVLFRQLCVDSTPLTNLDQLTQDLILGESGRWDISKKTVIPFEPKLLGELLPEELALMKKYPALRASTFSISSCLLEPDLTQENYNTRMHHLLYIEEMARFSSIAKFNVATSLQIVSGFMLMPSAASNTAKYAQNGEMFARLRLTSQLSEDTSAGRLVLQNVHAVHLAPYDPTVENPTEPEVIYEALVEDKVKNFVFLRLSKKCVTELGLKADTDFHAQVQMQMNRLPLCEMHQAVDKLSDVKLVFPSLTEKPSIPWNPLKQWKDNLDSRLNAKQREAVVAITADPAPCLPPILIVGPYGTGKTFTLAQATKEVLKREETRVLICTHSNSAADLYVKDYFHPYVTEGHEEARPLRVYYRHRWLPTINPAVQQYCVTGFNPLGGTTIQMPSREQVMKHRIIIVTLSTSRYLYNMNLPEGFFTHILLDEAAQAIECETIMPIALAGLSTRIVLAGDHMQLSPEVHSDFARDRNVHISFLERMYDHYPADHPCKILLCENYRSHSAIINYTSELFYEGRLLASGKQPPHNVFYPLTFFTARGEDVQHQNSTAFYNNAEVYEIVERVAELEKSWPKNWGDIEDNGIGVVSPYTDQVVRIRSELRKRKLHRISVERVLNVQGKQFRVIFLSTVRTRHTCSSDASLEELIDYGFLSNVKLLNTAITRAQSLVAVVGDPVSLCSIGKCRKLWERFIQICHTNSSLYGISWSHLRAQLDGVELKKTYILNPLAPEFIPNRLRHTAYKPPEPVAYGKYGYTFTQQQQQARSAWASKNRAMFAQQQAYQSAGPYAALSLTTPPSWQHSDASRSPGKAGIKSQVNHIQHVPAASSPAMSATTNLTPAGTLSTAPPLDPAILFAGAPLSRTGSIHSRQANQQAMKAQQRANQQSHNNMAYQPIVLPPVSVPPPTLFMPGAVQYLSGGPVFLSPKSRQIAGNVPSISPPIPPPPPQSIPGHYMGYPLAPGVMMPYLPVQSGLPPLGRDPSAVRDATAMRDLKTADLFPQNKHGQPPPEVATNKDRFSDRIAPGVSPSTITDIPVSTQSPQQIQFLPSACNISTTSSDVNAENQRQRYPSGGSLGKPLPEHGQETSAAAPTYLLYNKTREQLLLTYPHLQKEFYNYIFQTEGLAAAGNFATNLLQHQQHNRKGPHDQQNSERTHHTEHISQTASPHHHMNGYNVGQQTVVGQSNVCHPSALTGFGANPQHVQEHYSGMIKTEQTPRSVSRESVGSHSTMSDLSAPSRRSSLQSEQSSDSHTFNNHLSPAIIPGFKGPSSSGTCGRRPHSLMSTPESKNSLEEHKAVYTNFHRPEVVGHSSEVNENCTSEHNPEGLLQLDVPTDQEPLKASLEQQKAERDMDAPATLEQMIRFLEEEEERQCEAAEASGHLNAGPADIPEDDAGLERQGPLYMRRPGQNPGPPRLSYASALRSHPPPSSPTAFPLTPETPQTPLGLQGATGGANPFSLPNMSDHSDPLEVLKNLNIKASPGTQALYQYFS